MRVNFPLVSVRSKSGCSGFLHLRGRHLSLVGVSRRWLVAVAVAVPVAASSEGRSATVRAVVDSPGPISFQNFRPFLSPQIESWSQRDSEVRSQDASACEHPAALVDTERLMSRVAVVGG
ncbi:hypothetical protein MPTK2_2g13980 [Marchantia polymorpha subsp. ruderalis]